MFKCNSDVWYVLQTKSRTCQQNGMTILKTLIFAMVVLCILGVFVSIFVPKSAEPCVSRACNKTYMPSKPPPNYTPCLTRQCNETAAQFLSNINPEIDPCLSFYGFVCGNFPTNNPVPPNRPSVTQITKITDAVADRLQSLLEEPINEDLEPTAFKKLKRFYRSCLDVDKFERVGIAGVQKLLEDVGGWPVVKDLRPETSWQSVDYKLMELGFKPSNLINVVPVLDMRNTSRRLLQVQPLDFVLKASGMMRGRRDPIVRAYHSFKTKTAIYFGASVYNAHDDMDEVVELEINLAKAAQPTDNEVNNVSYTYNLYSVRKLQAEFPELNWKEYLGNVLPKNLTLREDDERLVVLQPNYVRALMGILKETSNRTMRNYILSNKIIQAASILNKKMRDLYLDFKAAVLGQKEPIAREKECIDFVLLSHWNIVASSLYAKKVFDAPTKPAAALVVRDILENFKSVVSDNGWLKHDKEEAVAKIEALYPSVAYPDELLDNIKIDSYFKTFDVDEDDFFGTYLRIGKFKRDHEFNRLYEPVNRTDWEDSANAVAVNAFYNRKKNALRITAAFLQGLLFDTGRPNYLNFASLGYIAGHEISHALDSAGHQYDKNGNARNWWSADGLRDYRYEEQCMVDQYSGFEIQWDLYLNGRRTLPENMADFGGLKVAYRSYKKWKAEHGGKEVHLPGMYFTTDQLFWMSAANLWCENVNPELQRYLAIVETHSPGRFRVNGPMMNLKEFADDFGCPVGSRMNPRRKCTPW